MMQPCLLWGIVLCLFAISIANAKSSQPVFHPRICFSASTNAKLPSQVDVTFKPTGRDKTARVAVFKRADARSCTVYNTTGNLRQGTYDIEVWKSLSDAEPLIVMDERNIEDTEARTRMTAWFNWDENLTDLTFDGGRQPNDINFGYVRIVNLAVNVSSSKIFLYHRNSNCYRCNASLLNATATVDESRSTEYHLLQSNFPEELSISTGDRRQGPFADLGNQSLWLGERGFYSVLVTGRGSNLTMEIRRDIAGEADHGPNLTPVYFTLLILVLLFAAYYGSKACLPVLAGYISKSQAVKRTYSNMVVNSEDLPSLSDEGASSNQNTSAHAIADVKHSKERLRSLDSFRGFALTIMIFVNYNGGYYWFFNHSVWNGLTVADLVFPWFIWIMGTSMAIAFNSLFKRQTSLSTMLYKVARRSAILFALGIFLISSFKDLRNGRIPGVLQRFAVSYAAVALIILFVPKLPSLHVVPPTARDGVASPPPLAQGRGKVISLRTAEQVASLGGGTRRWLSWFIDVAPYLWEWLAVVLLAVAHTCITFLMPVPGCPTGYLGPGGALAEFGRFAPPEGQQCGRDIFCCEGGASGWIDRQVFGWRHIYGNPTSQDTYQTGPYDPEGLLGCITSILMAYLGLQSGKIVLHYKSRRGRSVHWLSWSFVCCLIGAILCNFEQNGGVIPVSKNLWSLSFILLLAGFAFFLLTVFYWLIDVLNLWDGAPFRYVGMNSIFIYCFHETFEDNFPLSWNYMDGDINHGREMFMNVFAVSLLCLMCYYCYTINFFIKV